MKNSYLLVLALSWVFNFGCKNKEEVDNSKDQKIGLSAEDSVCAINPLEGYWLSVQFQKDVLFNLSPYKSTLRIEKISEIAADSSKVKLVYANAEGELLNYTINEGEKFELKLENDISFKYVGNNAAKAEGKKIDVLLSKVEEPLQGRSILEQFVISRLFVGQYDGKFGDVTFYEDGRVKGLENYKSFKVFTTFDELSDFDLIEFRDLNEKAEYKAWQIQNDILILYNIVPGSAYLFEKGNEWLRLKLESAVG